MAGSSGQYVEVGGRRLRVTSLDKVLYPATGTTKGDVIAYYQQVAPLMVPQVAWRPATRKRWPDGVGTPEEPGEVFFVKNLETYAPEWVPRFRIEHSHRAAMYPLINEVAVLAWLGQVAALEIHTPQWRFDSEGERRNPDRLVLDLDPGPGAGLPECAEVARLCRALLDDMGLASFPVTSGSKGIHLYAGLPGTNTSEEVSAVARELARALEADHPDLLVSTQKRSLRGGKVLVDWSQNSASKTTVAPYSLRGRDRPLVAAPRTWEEIDAPDLAQLDHEQVLKRLDVDPMGPLGFTGDVTAPEPDRLSTYRSMRDAAKTPEPVPTDAPAVRDGGEPTFVIQEHHARRLHWDFRLERDGVLVSWAIPKGPPMSGEKNRLAVQTEDHPLEYGTFEGTIPRGEYGAGEVSIWDSGTYTLEKWREGEVIAILHGRPDGGLGGEPYRFALILTKGMGDRRNWLIHRMQAETSASNVASREKTTPASKGVSAPASAPPDSAELPAVEPMLATLGDLTSLSSREEWRYEMKWDGVRAVVSVDTAAGAVLVRSRSGRDVTRTYPEAAELLGLVDEPCVLDGEIVAMREGHPDFGLLQRRMGLTKRAEVEAEAARTPVDLLVFDVLHAGGASLLRRPYTERRQRLETLVRPGERVHVPESFSGGAGVARQALDASRDLRLEGIIAKRATSTYRPGTRSKAWIKIKHARTQDVVVIGMRASTADRPFASLLVAVQDDGALRYAGRVGTGFSERALAAAAERLGALVRETTPVDDVPEADRRDATWVEPTQVGEVTFAERTGDGLLRHAVWRGWRDDADPAHVRWEE